MSGELFEPFKLSDLTLTNRMVMAPLTRNRADRQNTVTPMMVKYYQQRSSAGLIITESAPISSEAIGYPGTPGIFNENHVSAWRNLTETVHVEGGHIFIQLQYCGRISHPSLLTNNAIPVAPSAIKPEGQAITLTGYQDFVQPRALEINEIAAIVAQFKGAAKMAKKAGFDGIEVHGANGYIIDQFLRDGSNRRQDNYGGNIENRMRFLNEVLDAVCEIWPANRVGVRLTPENSFNSMSDSAPQAHFEYIVSQLSSRKLAYIHVLEGDMMNKSALLDYRAIREKYRGTYMANNGYNLLRANDALNNDRADLVAFGTPFLANPDLVYRYQENLALNEADPSTFYGGNEVGYTDYPLYSGDMN
jgi:N-ethylmaleimide reductase